MDAIIKLTLSDERLQSLVRPMLGLPFCRVKVGEFFSLSIGLGKMIPSPLLHSGRRLNTNFYGEWELGSYFSSWRVIRRSEILYSGTRNMDTENELNKRLAGFEFGYLKSIGQLSEWDVRVESTNDLYVDFMGVDSCDETFHVFCPNNVSVVFKSGVGWFVGPSNQPWVL
jgi:hypothetical protein